MRDYKKYDVWQKAHELVLFIYKEVVPSLPKSEQYELASQIKRAAYSIPMNIAEGCGRKSDKDFAHFLDVSLGSLHELEYCAQLIFDLEFISKPVFEELNERINEVKAKLINLIKAIRS
ncbi:MAG TPA: four helix bundle protein [Chitinophagaceae bacterium]|nr:four helix bundle protein [Chitinophagales bacterium]HPG12871.1 four helix bundle protein [Chitinophagaceae bacterium]